MFYNGPLTTVWFAVGAITTKHIVVPCFKITRKRGNEKLSVYLNKSEVSEVWLNTVDGAGIPTCKKWYWYRKIPGKIVVTVSHTLQCNTNIFCIIFHLFFSSKCMGMGVCKGGKSTILFAWARDAPAPSIPEG